MSCAEVPWQAGCEASRQRRNDVTDSEVAVRRHGCHVEHHQSSQRADSWAVPASFVTEPELAGQRVKRNLEPTGTDSQPPAKTAKRPEGGWSKDRQPVRLDVDIVHGAARSFDGGISEQHNVNRIVLDEPNLEFHHRCHEGVLERSGPNAWMDWPAPAAPPGKSVASPFNAVAAALRGPSHPLSTIVVGCSALRVGDCRCGRRDERVLDQLRSYQHLGVAFLLDSPAALLADEMGLGKTVQVLTALDRMRRASGGLSALVVAPASVKTNWFREAQRWAPGATVRVVQGNRSDRRAWYDLPVHILIASYDQVRMDFLLHPPETQFDVVILDEAQRVKDPASDTTVAVARISRRFTWALTATPLENRAKDLETIIRLLRPGSLYEEPTLPEIHEVLQGLFLRRRKIDVLPELPPIIDEDLRIDLLPQQREVYEDVWRGRGTYADSVTHVLALITKLKQICNFDPESNTSGKLDALLDIVDAVRDENGKLLVFSQFVETLRWLEERLPIATSIIHGEMTLEARQLVLDRFDDAEHPIACLVSLRAGGVGLNIPTASHVVLYDRWWNPALEDQAVHRAHRFGRKDPLMVFRLLASDTVEERINEVLQAKRDLFEHYVDNAPSRAASLSIDELRSILDLDSIDIGGDTLEVK